MHRRLIAALFLILLAGRSLAQFGLSDPKLVEEEWLVPGSGWTQPTPATVHPGEHSDAVAIAHWTRAPDQELWRQGSAHFRVGVLGYHRSGVAMVRFAVDAGPWLEVDQMRRSRQTDHYGYSVVLRAESFSPGWHEVRAVVVPEQGPDRGGTERVLTWRFYNALGEVAGVDYAVRWVDPVGGSDSSGDGTSGAPFFSIRRAIDSVVSNPEGARIYLGSAGSQSIPIGGQTLLIQNDRPITIRRAPGEFPRLGPQSTATLDQLQVRNLRFEELKIDFSWTNLLDRNAAAGDGPLVIDNCFLQGYTHPAATAMTNARLTPPGVDEQVYLVDSRAQDFRGVLNFKWGRGVTINGAKGVVEAQALIDSEILDTNAGFSATLTISGDENGLADGIAVRNSVSLLGPVGGGATDGTAIVNSLFDGSMGTQYFETVSIFSNTRRHLLLLHSSFVNTYVQVDSQTGFPGSFDLEHGLVFGVVADFFTDESANGFFNNTSNSPAGLKLDTDTIHTHHTRPNWSSWTNTSLANTYVDYAGGDFRVRAASVAAAKIPASDAYVRFDLEGEPRGAMTAVGALKGQDE